MVRYSRTQSQQGVMKKDYCILCGEGITYEHIITVQTRRPLDDRNDPIETCSPRCSTILRKREYRERLKAKMQLDNFPGPS